MTFPRRQKWKWSGRLQPGEVNIFRRDGRIPAQLRGFRRIRRIEAFAGKQTAAGCGMKPIQELQRLASPTPKPQSLAWDGATLWMGSRDTKVISALNPVTWTVGWQVTAPGIPWGMTAVDGELRVLCGETADDHRIIRRCVPGQGFDAAFGITCPDDTGSHLSFDGHALIVSQWYPKKLIAVGVDEKVGRVITVPRGICGHTFAEGVFYLVTTEAEETNDYWLMRVDPRLATPKVEDLAQVPFQARGLAFDGKYFWTNHRAADQVVCFTL